MIAIVGAGPAGISAAVEAKKLGFEDIIIFEKTQTHNATINHFYKDHKRVDKAWMGKALEPIGSVAFNDCSKEDSLKMFQDLIDTYQLNMKYGEEVERIAKQDSIFTVHTSHGDYEADFVIIAIGCMGKPNKPTYQIPSSLKTKVDFNLDRVQDGESILVVGGGNSAAEYAFDLSVTCDVALSYRKQNFTRLNAINLLNLSRANSNGKIRLLMGTSIKELQEENDKVKVLFDDLAPEYFDRVIYAIGGTTPVDFLRKCEIALDGGQPVLDILFETKNHNMFISGDLGYTGNGSIVAAFNSSYTILQTISKRSHIK